MDSARVIMLDATLGNDYSVCLCLGLSAVGVDVSLVVPENRVVNTSTDFEVKRLMPTKGPGTGGVRKIFPYLKYLTQLSTYVTKNDIGVVHFQFFRRERIESVFFLLLRLLGTSLVYTAHNVLPHESRRLDHLFRFVVYRSAKMIIVHSQHIKKKLAKTFRVNPAKIRVIPHGNFDIYLPEESVSRAEARAHLSLSDEDSIGLFFGFIREYKGLDLLLDAFQAITRHNERLKLVIAGAPQTPELENRYRKKIIQISRNDSILFHPRFIPSEEVATYFLASDIVILPYEEIDHSGIIHLAYSFGRPVIAADVGDFAEMVEDGKSGYLLNENTPQCLAEAMLGAFSDRDRLEEMGAYARHLSETKYSWRNAARHTMSVYEEVIDAS